MRDDAIRRTQNAEPRTDALSIGIISLGCAKNLVDSQVMAGVLLSEHLTLAPSPEEADIILVNTCAFIEDARAEAAEAILRACQHKAAGGCRAVIVAGCLPQRYRDQVAETFPDVDAFIGVDELDRIGEIVRQVAAGRHGMVAVGDGAPTRLFRPQRPGLRFSGGPFAWLKVAEGCNHACAFCAIPGIRGRYRSRGLEELVTEAQALLASGVRELNLISQDTTSYGRDLRNKPFAPRGGAPAIDGCGGSATPWRDLSVAVPQKNAPFCEPSRLNLSLTPPASAPRLPALLRALDQLDGDFWIRVLYGYPSRVTDELLEVMAASRHVCAYLDLPIQHSHPDMLRAMRRADSVRAVAELPQRLRLAVPGMVLRTTCLVGFPGETEEHFRHLLSYVEAAKFDHLGVFTFSSEEGTAAFERADAPPAEVALERRDRLMRLQRRVVDERRRTLVGAISQALLLSPLESSKAQSAKHKARIAPLWLARLPRQAPDVDGVTQVQNVPAGSRLGQFIPVRITGGRGYDLEAEAQQSGAYN